MRQHILLSVIVVALVWSAAPIGAVSSPASVSPGSGREVTRVESRCPAFSWGAVEGARGYELLVYRLPVEDEVAADGEPSNAEGGLTQAEATLRERLPAGALSWTPSMERCLAPGGRYAWLVRADGSEGPSEWSEPRLFEVAAGPSPAEVERALATLEAYMAAGGVEIGATEENAIARKEPGAEPSTGDSGTAAEAPTEDVPVADVTAILGQVPDSTGVTFGMHGVSASTDGGSAGVVGESTATSGATLGVVGEVDSAAGTAGAFDNTAGGQILSGRNNAVEVFSVNGTGDVAMAGLVDGVDIAGHAIEANAHHVPPTALPPSGPAGGDLSGTFPDPEVVDDSHSHTGTTVPDLWVDEAGDTMTGTLTTVDVMLGGRVLRENTLGDDHVFLHATPDSFSVGVGRATLPNSTGSANTASGAFALGSNTDGFSNTASGFAALYSNTTGSFNAANGFYALYTADDDFGNTASGAYALTANDGGDRNTAGGAYALRFNTTGANNTASGNRALYQNLGGNDNTASGYRALYSNESGYRNTASGNQALSANTTGHGNTASGFGALRSNDIGYRNTAVGLYAGRNATTGRDNIFLGSGADGVAGESNTIRIGGALVGTGAGEQNRTFINGISGVTPAGATESVVVDANGQLGSTAGGAGSGIDADTLDSLDSTAFMLAGTDLWVDEAGDTMTGTLTTVDVELGGRVLRGGQVFLHEPPGGGGNTGLGRVALSSITAGRDNTASGTQTLYSNTGGDANTANGTRALFSNDTGSFNTASGRAALQANTTGSSNTANSYRALYNNDTGDFNTASGRDALFDNISGSYNTATGSHALQRTTGDRNAAIGWRAGYSATTGSDNIFLGSGAYGVAAENNTIRIGGTMVGAGIGLQNRTFINGIRGVTTGAVDAVAVVIDSNGQLGTVSSSRRYKTRIEDMEDASESLLDLRPVTFLYKQEPVEGQQPLQFGLIAEEVAEVLPELVVYGKDGQPETVRYHLLSSLLLNELQKQHGLNLEQEQELERLRARLGHLEGVEPKAPQLSERRPPPARDQATATGESRRR